MKRGFPDRDIVEVPKDHPVYSSFTARGYPQIAGWGRSLPADVGEGGYISTFA